VFITKILPCNTVPESTLIHTIDITKGGVCSVNHVSYRRIGVSGPKTSSTNQANIYFVIAGWYWLGTAMLMSSDQL